MWAKAFGMLLCLVSALIIFLRWQHRTAAKEVRHPRQPLHPRRLHPASPKRTLRHHAR
jgi:hypothetical protein